MITSKTKRSYIEQLEGKALQSQEKYIYDVKQRIWNEYDNEEIASSVLASIISDVERSVLVAYQLGMRHGSNVGREKGFKDAIDIVFKGAEPCES
ncbi:hypothetical protein KC717_06485 [Candidatus Dojkabacteria bacterium]|uniref:Uncharacterized protein n=1 Tax=Candidatus Dojkabacteria bacterium TaxID=2099670 RepID=A0A955RLF5_9BACT|nr:hypothetical protein [Candidatus Dojkabacteria bacterium]